MKQKPLPINENEFDTMINNNTENGDRAERPLPPPPDAQQTFRYIISRGKNVTFRVAIDQSPTYEMKFR